MDSAVRTVRLADDQRVAVDRSLAIRCQASARAGRRAGRDTGAPPGCRPERTGEAVVSPFH